MAINVTMNIGEPDDWARQWEEPAPASLGRDGTVFYPSDIVGRLYPCDGCGDQYVSKEAYDAHSCPDHPALSQPQPDPTMPDTLHALHWSAIKASPETQRYYTKEETYRVQ